MGRIPSFVAKVRPTSGEILVGHVVTVAEIGHIPYSILPVDVQRGAIEKLPAIHDIRGRMGRQKCITVRQSKEYRYAWGDFWNTSDRQQFVELNNLASFS